MPKINKPTKISAEDGCGYQNEIEIERQNRWMNIQKIYPNPVTDVLTIALEGISNDEVQIQMLNSIGQVIYFSNFQITEGFQNLSFPIEGLKEGVYFMILQNDCIRQTEKIVVTK